MSKSLHVLIAEDSENDAMLAIERLRRGGFEIAHERVDTPEAMAEALKNRQWDLVISDYRMPHFSGPDALALFKRAEIDIPFIIISGTVGEETAIACMKAGAHDYMMKDNLARLPVSVERELKEAENRRESRRLQSQLLQAQKMETIGRLAGGIAHDFNNILTAIVGVSQLAMQDLKDDNPLKKDLQEILECGQRAARLTQQLLTFSRRQIMEPDTVDLNALIARLDKMLRRVVGENIELSTKQGLSLWPIRADAGHLEQVIVNLMVNARDAMPDGGKISIETMNATLDDSFARAHPGAHPGEHVLLTITDTGTGMSDEVKSHLFEPFFTTKEQGKGTGLGLATCYGIVKQSGGYIAIDSVVGRGTTFQIYFPRLIERVQSPPVQEKPTASSHGTETILLVEDDPSVRKLAYRILKQQGYSVLEAQNPQDALNIVRKDLKRTISLVMTDIVLPKGDGKLLADEIKSLRGDVKILYTSGYTDDTIALHGVLDSGISFLPKPFAQDDLLKKVRQVLDQPS